MSRQSSYLPFPLFLAIATVVGLSAWYTISTYSRFAAPLSVNEVSSTSPLELDASPTPSHLELGQELTFDLNLHSGTDPVSGIALALGYDDSKLRIESIVNTPYLPQITTPAEIGSQLVTATYHLGEGESGKSDWGTLAHIKLKALALGSQSITLNDATKVYTTAYPDGLLPTLAPLTIQVDNVGDLDYDGKVDLLDYNLFLGAYEDSPSYADLDGSGTIDSKDYQLFVSHYGQVNP